MSKYLIRKRGILSSKKGAGFLEKIFQTAFSSTVSVIALFILTRLIGKKQMAQLTFFDYVIGISIGSIAAEYAVYVDVDARVGITSLVVFTLFSFAVSLVCVKSYSGRKLLDGMPIILIKNGRFIEGGLKKAKLTVNDLLEECRQKDVFDVADIELAILETSGKLSVLIKSQHQPLTPIDMGIQTGYKGLCVNVVIDGKAIHENLHALNLDDKWLRTELQNQGYEDSSSALLAYIDSDGVLVVHPKGAEMPKGNLVM